MYSVQGYGSMLAYPPRVQAYTDALRAVVFPGCTLVEIGAGIGYFSMLACQLGARRVYAIEPDPTIHLASKIAAQNGYGGKIEFIQKLSTEVELPERADVMLSDLRGVLPLFERHIPSIVDARERLLRPGGLLIPQQDRIYAAVVEAASKHEFQVTPPQPLAAAVDMSLARKLASNSWCKARFTASELLSDPQLWAMLDYNRITDPNCGQALDFVIGREGVAHGVALWFDTDLYDNIGFSNHPGCPENIYGQAFFSFEQPITVNAGTRISLLLQATLTGDDYTWRWDSSVTDAAGRPVCSFKQSTLLGVPFSLEQLRKRSNVFVPSLNVKGEIEQFILGLMDGKNSLREIAQQVHARFPGSFRDVSASFDRVCSVSEKYSR